MLLKNSLRSFATKLGFSKSHVWVKFDTESQTGRLGITNFAQKSIGDVSSL